MKGSRLVLMFLASLFIAAASAQDKYPSKPITVVVPYATGTTTDLIARAFAPKLQEILGQPVIVQNRAGAGGTIATQSVAVASADGYTLLMANSTHAINPTLYTKLTYDSRRDFLGVALVAESAYLIVAGPQLGAKTLKEFVALAKQKPGSINYASAGVGTSTHLAASYFSSLAGIEIVHVPYKNSSDYIADLLSGRVQVSFVPTAFLLTHIKSGKLLALGVSTRDAMKTPLEVPSAREAGIDYEYTAWFGLLAPSKVSPAILEQLSRAVRQAQEHPDIKAEFAKLGLSGRNVPLAEFDAYIKTDMDKLGPFVKASGAKAE
ncbi:MAG: tripartite tricarboxylate transporter substrate binding protein [Betaproteobacteria bacterium]